MKSVDTNHQNPAANPVGMEVYKLVFGKSGDLPLIGLREFTVNHLFANIWSRSDEKHQIKEEEDMISMKERSMITVALLAAHGSAEDLRKHVSAALNQLNITKQQLLEIMIHVAHYAGWSCGNAGQKIVLEISEAKETEIKTEKELKEININIGEAEENGKIDFFENLLADELIFRRANGNITTKQSFLYDLKPGAFHKLVTEVQEVKTRGDYAVVQVKVVAKRTTEESEGEYLNIRSFVKRNGDWKLITWLNTKISK